MSDLVYRKTESERSESPIDKKKARIDAILRVVVIFSLGAILAGVGFVAVSSLTTSQQNNDILDALLANQEQIADQTSSSEDIQKQLLALAKDIENCNTPNGDCYQQRIAELSAQSGQVNAITLAAAYCAISGDVTTYKEMTSCVKGLTGSLDGGDRR